MGFAITSGGGGLIGAVIIGLVIPAGAIALASLLTGAKLAHDAVVEEESDKEAPDPGVS